MLSTLLQCCIVIVMQRKLTVVVVVVETHVSLSPSLPGREKTNQGRAAVCVGDL